MRTWERKVLKKIFKQIIHIKQCNELHSLRLDAAAGRTGVYTGSANMVYNKHDSNNSTLFYTYFLTGMGAQNITHIF